MNPYMLKRLFPLLVFICAVLAFFIISPVVSADTVSEAVEEADEETGEEAPATDALLYVYDKAGLFTDSEAGDLEDKCAAYGEEAGIEIMILTHNDSGAPYAETYIEDFEDRLPEGDRVHLLIDMANRVVFIQGYGKAETYIHSKRGDAILDEMDPDLADGNFYDACVTYIKMAAAYMSDDSELNYDHDYSAGKPQSGDPDAPYYDETWPSEYNSPGSNTGTDGLSALLSNVFVQMIIALAIGGITVGIMAYHSSGRMTAGAGNYIDSGRSGLIGRRDDYIRTTVTRVRKPQPPQNNNTGGRGGFNSGGFRGGVSSGGRSHSSAGRGF